MFRQHATIEGEYLQLTGSPMISGLLTRVQTSWQHDPKLQKLCTEIQHHISYPKYTWDVSFLRRKGKLVVGKDLALKKELFSYFEEGATVDI